MSKESLKRAHEKVINSVALRNKAKESRTEWLGIWLLIYPFHLILTFSVIGLYCLIKKKKKNGNRIKPRAAVYAEIHEEGSGGGIPSKRSLTKKKNPWRNQSQKLATAPTLSALKLYEKQAVSLFCFPSMNLLG